ncbi:hypothetical protein [Streptomyces sp. TRM49041]|uniref:hypothetical protein n=1 Tax=Streptomyces sp. TRM49041 TaxID=2603216 RepID=UPI0011EED98B|nr:hypothetical protein [Streptomyces sp. TRM49041]
MVEPEDLVPAGAARGAGGGVVDTGDGGRDGHLRGADFFGFFGFFGFFDTEQFPLMTFDDLR